MTRNQMVGAGASSALVDRVRPRRGVAVSIVAFGIAALVIWGDGPTPYVSTQWLFSYGDGLLSRSLVGTVYRAFGGGLGRELRITAVVVYLLVVGVLGFLVSRYVSEFDDRVDVATPLVVGLLVAPSGIPALAASLGRLDNFVVLVTVAAIVVAARGRQSSTVGVGVLLLLGVAIHEAALAVVPWLCVYLAWRRSYLVAPQRAWAEAALAAVPAGLLVLVVSVHEPTMSLEVLAGSLGEGIVREHERVLSAGTHYRGLVENVALMEPWFRANLFVGAVANAAAVLPVAMLGVLALRSAGVRLSRRNVHLRLLLLASLGPLALCVVAWDWGRWFSASATLFGVTCCLLVRDAEQPDEWPARLMWAGVAMALLVTCIAGGTGEHPFGLSPNG